MPTTIIQLFRTAFIVINNKFGSCHRSTPNYSILKNDRIERNDFNDFSFKIYRANCINFHFHRSTPNYIILKNDRIERNERTILTISLSKYIARIVI